MIRYISVYQIPLDGRVATRNWINLSFDSAINTGFNLDPESYECVFDGKIEVPDEAYAALGCVKYELPSYEDFTGRPIDVSDIITLEGDWYYVDPHGFVLFDTHEYA